MSRAPEPRFHSRWDVSRNVSAQDEDADSSPDMALDLAISRTQQWFVDSQSVDGFWVGELEGDSILQSETILLLAWLGEHRSTLALRCANQLADGSRSAAVSKPVSP
jgi:squalene-hopene/tetraprenyl-beta-curcumene cyclase